MNPILNFSSTKLHLACNFRLTYFLSTAFCCCFLGCNPSNQADNEQPARSSETIINRVTINHAEIRRDILSELDRLEISYWINDDNSIGFPPAQAETIDSIYYEVVGAYAARN